MTANPKKLDDAEVQRTRRWLHGYLAKFGHEPDVHPPDDKIVAQFLSVAEWPRLEKLLYDLMAERKEPGHSYAWFVTVALQRIHGIAPQQLQQRRAELKLVKQPPPPEPVQQNLVEHEQQLAEQAVAEVRELQRELRAAAATKGMR